MNCQIEYVSSDSDIGMPCGKRSTPGAGGKCSEAL